MEITHLLKNQKPIQVIIEAVVNNGPKEEEI